MGLEEVHPQLAVVVIIERAEAVVIVVYRRLAFARLDGRWLPQLVYSVWFPARAAESRFDPPAGAFDGFTWRVTIGSEGRPLLFDTMRSLPLPRGGRKSAFGADGGVVDMRQLDDPHLLDKYFELE